ncbi:oligosaccharide repeat unit polymerase [Nocardioides jejuensis]|uniref:Oligosaccharide repeat unit polymerase n=1 Tax=Nocardioides jejuensis TaxID=2502782 RepID=A0A4R1CGX7_9ACTN|nr:oligosaccharide repeat unit polymerase [Nocardioides jejuensis]TCJ30211.1 oligosaccharide repeat unit polymerase [Nocardioides jejuensis]
MTTVLAGRRSQRSPGVEARSETGPILPVSRAVAGPLVAFWLVATAAGLAWYLGNAQGIFFLTGAASCFVVTLPLVVLKDYDLITPWTVVVAVSYLAYGIRGTFISLGVDGTRTLEQLYFLGRAPEEFVNPSGIFFAGICSLTLGYVVTARRRRRSSRILRLDAVRGPVFVQLVITACALLGFVGFYMFARSTGGFSLASLSAKRTLVGGTEASASYESHGGWRFLHEFALIAFWVQIAVYSVRKKSHGVTDLRGWWVAALFLNAASLPIYASTRQDIVVIGASGLAIKYCLSHRGVSKKFVFGFAAIVVVLVVAISSLRSSHTGDVRSAQVSGTNLLSAFVLTRTFADVPTTGQIIMAVPAEIPFANGESITDWFFAPIPRSIWPSKPVISMGPLIAEVVYHMPSSGVPPGVIAEGYLNFGVGGALIVPFLAGALLGPISRRWSEYARTSPGAAVLLSAVALRMGSDLGTNGLGYAMYQLAIGLLLTIPVLMLVFGPARKA